MKAYRSGGVGNSKESIKKNFIIQEVNIKFGMIFDVAIVCFSV